jgi:hypothetical protein
VVDHRAQKAGSARGLDAVGQRAELEEEIQRPGRRRPSQRVEDGELGRGRVGHEDRTIVCPERGGPQLRQLVFPEAQLPAGTKLLRHQTDRRGPMAGGRGVLRIHAPDFRERFQPVHDAPRSARRIAWSAVSMNLSRNAIFKIWWKSRPSGHFGSGSSAAGSKWV